ncbi:MAG TPA: radical SAM protein [Verrucomicrobiota bacterium]|nr:radical SAM protein [Verrucomicrobiota bacterium]HNU52297.1 radical SAM protein [Verrucomicrobiota bacterium]
MDLSGGTLRQRNREAALEAWRRGETSLESRPVALFIELTQRCNLACAMCRSTQSRPTASDMSEAVLRYIEAELLPSASLVDLRGWGESTLRRDFSGLVERFGVPGVQLRLVTNGACNDSQVWRRLMERRAIVAVSLDAADDVTLRRLRGISLERVLDTLRELVRWRDRCGVPDRHVAITAVVGAPNLEQMPQLVRLAAQIGIRRVICFALIALPADPWHLSHRPLHEITALLDQARLEALDCGVELRLGSALHESLTLDAHLLPRCLHPWMYCYVDYLGRVGFCDHLVGRVDYTVGRLGERSVSELWNGATMVALRSQHVSRQGDGGLFYPCAWCYRNRYPDFEEVLDETWQERSVSTCVVDRLYGLHPERTSSRPFVAPMPSPAGDA